jgi:hypothetical protein
MTRQLSRMDTNLSSDSKYESADESPLPEDGTENRHRKLSRRTSIVKLIRQASHASINAYQGAIKVLSGSNYSNQRRRSSVRRKWGVDRSLIELVRERVIELMDEEEAKSNKEKGAVFHAKDVLHIRETDDMITRFLLEYFEDHPLDDKNCDEAVVVKNVSNLIIETLHWRMSTRINDLKASDFPAEFYKAGIYVFGEDSDGCPVLYIKGRRYKKTSSHWTPLFVDFLLYESEKKLVEIFGDPFNPKNPSHRPGVVMDCTGVSVAQVDMGLIFALIPLVKHYPQTFNYVWAYEMPWYCRPFLNITLKLLPTRIVKKVKQMDKKSAINEMGSEGIPSFMGGTSPIEPHIAVPEDASNIRDVGLKNNIPEAEIKKMIAFADALINEKS